MTADTLAHQRTTVKSWGQWAMPFGARHNAARFARLLVEGKDLEPNVEEWDWEKGRKKLPARRSR